MYATDPSDSNIHAAVQQHGHGLPIQILQANVPWKVMTDLRDRINDEVQQLEASGIHLVSWGPNAARNKLNIVVTNDPSQVEPQLQARYGTNIVVTRGESGNRTASRLNDASPFNGGDITAMDNNGDCTLGPAVKSASGHVYSLTAGHCYLSGTSSWSGNYIYRTFNGSHFISGGANTLMGNAAAELVNNGYDVGLVDMSASGLDFRTAGTGDTGAAVAQKTSFGSTPGTSVCVSGAYSGERCGATVTDVDQSILLGGVTTIHSVIASASYDLEGPGDSGAPVYTVQSTGLYLTGLQYGPSGSLACTRNNNVASDRPNHCSSTVYYQDLNSVLSHRSLTLYTR